MTEDAKKKRMIEISLFTRYLVPYLILY